LLDKIEAGYNGKKGKKGPKIALIFAIDKIVLTKYGAAITVGDHVYDR
jgi:hypothetical protein